MIFLLVVLLVCSFFVILDIRHTCKEEGSDCNGGKVMLGTRASSQDAKIASFLVSALIFGGLWIICFVLSVMMLAYAGYISVFGILAIRSALPIGKYFPWYAYLPLIPIGFFGAILLTYKLHNRGFIYKRLVWWFFPASLTCWMLSGLRLTIRTLGDSGMGDMIQVIFALPFFLVCFILAYIVTELSCHLVIWFKNNGILRRKRL